MTEVQEPANIDIGLRHTVEITRLERDMASIKAQFRWVLEKKYAALRRGKNHMAKRNESDVEFYRAQWRLLKSRCNILRADRATLLNGARVMEYLRKVSDG